MDEKDSACRGTCGFFCRSCAVYLATEKGREQQRNLAFGLSKEMGRSVSASEVQCRGCRSLTDSCWGKGCKIRACAVSRGITYCNECREFSCELLDNFAEIYQDIPIIQLKELTNLGAEGWVAKMKERWTCPNCGGSIEAGPMKCWSCGYKCRKHVEETLPPL